MIIRKIAATSGLAVAVRAVCSSRMPRIPVGMQATMINHANRSIGVSARRLRSVPKKALMISTQSFQK